jgi:hypothetical protein
MDHLKCFVERAITTGSGIAMRWEQSMKIVKRWGVMTLVALLVLGTMGAALADEGTTETESEAAKELPEKGEYLPVLEWADGIVAFVFYWGYGEEDEEPGCDPEETVPTTGGGLFGFGGGLVPIDTDSVDCVPLDVGRNGHVNHGSMVSSFVHWLKNDGNLDDLIANNPELENMPKGQLVKEFAHLDFGKGFFELEGVGDVESAEVKAEDADGHGQPNWVKDKKADKPGKGKNK